MKYELAQKEIAVVMYNKAAKLDKLSNWTLLH